MTIFCTQYEGIAKYVDLDRLFNDVLDLANKYGEVMKIHVFPSDRHYLHYGISLQIRLNKGVSVVYFNDIFVEFIECNHDQYID